MRLVACENSRDFLDWLTAIEYPEALERWGLGLLDGCYKYWVDAQADDGVIHGAVWYHWWEEQTLAVHLCASPRLIITANLIGDFYKIPELLGAKYLRAIIESEAIEEFARRAGWGTKPGETIYTASLPSRWARYNARSEDDGSTVRRGERARHIETGEADRGGPGEGEGRRARHRRHPFGEEPATEARDFP